MYKRKSKAKFEWESWDFDCEGESYVVAKRICLEKENVPDFLLEKDNLHTDCRAGMVVEEGWCKYQVRTDWENGDGEPRGGYYVETCEKLTHSKITGKRQPGWFPVWIVRKGEWY